MGEYLVVCHHFSFGGREQRACAKEQLAGQKAIEPFREYLPFWQPGVWRGECVDPDDVRTVCGAASIPEADPTEPQYHPDRQGGFLFGRGYGPRDPGAGVFGGDVYGGDCDEGWGLDATDHGMFHRCDRDLSSKRTAGAFFLPDLEQFEKICDRLPG